MCWWHRAQNADWSTVNIGDSKFALCSLARCWLDLACPAAAWGEPNRRPSSLEPSLAGQMAQETALFLVMTPYQVLE
jgi:hypothetical protein